MKAIVARNHGGPEVLALEDVSRPVPGTGEVLVRVHAVSVNTTLDIQVVAGTSGMAVTLPVTPGVDPSGVVEAVGDGVATLKIGDHVAASTGIPSFGGYAEFVLARESRANLIPDGVDFGTATVVRRHFGPASTLIEEAEIKPGEHVLVMGGAGALSTCIIQLAKEAGANVIAGAGADRRVDAAVSMGADHGINYRQADLNKEVLAITDGHGVDIVFENLGDPKLWTAAINSMARGGRLLTVGTHAGDGVLPVDVRQMYRNRLKIMSGLRSSDQPDSFFDTAIQGVASGKYRVLIDSVLPLNRAGEAFQRVLDNEAVGKVILDPTL